MNRTSLLLLAAVATLAPAATGQAAKASAKLFTRTEGTDLRFGMRDSGPWGRKMRPAHVSDYGPTSRECDETCLIWGV